MKLKKMNSKLTLNKSTVANLGNNELGAIVAGAIYSDNDYSCDPPCTDVTFDPRCPGMITVEPGCPDSVNPIYCDLSASSL